MYEGNDKSQHTAMELDSAKENETDYKDINALSIQELRIAQTIALSKIERTLYIHISIPPIYGFNSDNVCNTTNENALMKFVCLSCISDSSSSKRPPLGKNNMIAFNLSSLVRVDGIQIHNLRVPSFLHHVSCYLLMSKDHLPNGIFNRSGDSQKTKKMLEMVHKDGILKVLSEIQQTDLIELGGLFLHFISNIPDIIPKDMHCIFKSILAINQATGKVDPHFYSGVKMPTESTRKLIRYMIMNLLKLINL